MCDLCILKEGKIISVNDGGNGVQANIEVELKNKRKIIITAVPGNKFRIGEIGEDSCR